VLTIVAIMRSGKMPLSSARKLKDTSGSWFGTPARFIRWPA
jgi:hypothetical protein